MSKEKKKPKPPNDRIIRYSFIIFCALFFTGIFAVYQLIFFLLYDETKRWGPAGLQFVFFGTIGVTIGLALCKFLPLYRNTSGFTRFTYDFILKYLSFENTFLDEGLQTDELENIDKETHSQENSGDGVPPSRT